MTGTGTQSDPYIVYTPTDLQNVSLDLTAYYELGCNIDAAETTTWNGGAGFVPIGTYLVPFQGNFSGAGYTISNLFINRPATFDVGLFGCVTADDTHTPVSVRDLTLTAVNITGDEDTAACVGYAGVDTSNVGQLILSNITCSGTVVGSNYTGGAFGWLGDSDYAPDRLGSKVSGCASLCTVTGVDFVGGLVGYSDYMVFEYSYATGNVSGGEWVGGFIGYDDLGSVATIKQCAATGDVTATTYYAGGFAGEIGAPFPATTAYLISDCYARGDVNTPDQSGGFAGGLSFVNARHCYSTGAPTGAGDCGGFVGYDLLSIYTDSCWDKTSSGVANGSGPGGTLADVTGYTTAELQDINTISGDNWDVSRIWSISSSCNDGYPCLILLGGACPVTLGPPADPTIAPKKVSLELIRNLEIMNGGRAFIDKSGNFRWESRYHRG